ncbi:MULTISPECIES: cytochrome c [Roseateles]|uniref:Cytochrome c553 n=1 Tax=Pelomonas aquatica TaxID=431058 RepID=A0ABU1Z7Q1_9BURK|nr:MULTISPECIES: c-type cytochrome [Roseateles]KQY89194.1 cytochrome C [Pelomonas sp. Root1444]MDR7296638.1 cytochrome c553 [Pelomonas aquatica]
MKTVATLLSSLLLATVAQANEPAAAAAKPDLGKGGAISTQVCAACHTADGSRGAPANPIIAGQHAEYLAKQLVEFKTNKRKSPVMNGMAAPLSEEDIRNVAAFYASKTAKPGFAKSKDTVALGEKIYRGGIADRNVPACAGCHGPNGSGIPAQYPRIGGQHGDYVEAQMVAFRSGARANGPMMTSIAAKMNDKEIKAVSDYIAGLR